MQGLMSAGDSIADAIGRKKENERTDRKLSAALKAFNPDMDLTGMTLEDKQGYMDALALKRAEELHRAKLNQSSAVTNSYQVNTGNAAENQRYLNFQRDQEAETRAKEAAYLKELLQRGGSRYAPNQTEGGQVLNPPISNRYSDGSSNFPGIGAATRQRYLGAEQATPAMGNPRMQRYMGTAINPEMKGTLDYFAQTGQAPRQEFADRYLRYSAPKETPKLHNFGDGARAVEMNGSLHMLPSSKPKEYSPHPIQKLIEYAMQNPYRPMNFDEAEQWAKQMLTSGNVDSLIQALMQMQPEDDPSKLNNPDSTLKAPPPRTTIPQL